MNWTNAKPGEVWELTTTKFGTRTDLFYVAYKEEGLGTNLVFYAPDDYPVTYLGLNATVIASGELVERNHAIRDLIENSWSEWGDSRQEQIDFWRETLADFEAYPEEKQHFEKFVAGLER